jgi:glycosyltransferase involved in cell wall biosynthesis
MIGIAVTTKNRRDIALRCVSEWEKYLPQESKFIIVDDNSDEPFLGADYRFEKNAGIAIAKNKCIELLEGCEHIFLVDDDVWPISQLWWVPYVQSKQVHFCYTFQTGSTLISTLKPIKGELLKSSTAVRGCMMYYHKSVFERVGGFRNDFIGYGWEHIEFTNRIYNSGLTPERYLDVPHSESLFYSLDQQRETVSSVPSKERYFELNNKLLIYKKYQSSDYVDYKDQKELPPVLLTAYFTLRPDPQRGTKWPKTVKGMEKLIDSAKSHGIKTVVFYDSIDQCEIDSMECDLVEFVRIQPFKEFCTNVHRRIIFYEYLKYRHHPKIFMVDSTDVEVLKNPFEYIKDGILYVGDEMKAVKYEWVIKQFKRTEIDYIGFMDEFGSHQLLNAGIIGGYYDIVMEFLAKNTDIHRKYSVGLEESTDMAVFNYVVYNHFFDKHEHGEHINTPFKFDKYTDAIFKHK